MKKITIAIAVTLLTFAFSVASAACKPTDDKDKTSIIETTDLCSQKGYRDTTPVRVIISNGNVVSVEALPNRETPQFFQRVIDYLLPQYKGVKVKKALEMTSEPIPDGCTGATYSTRAVQQNIKCALKKYKEKK